MIICSNKAFVYQNLLKFYTCHHCEIDCILLCVLCSITKSCKHLYIFMVSSPVFLVVFTCCVHLMVLLARYHYRRVILGCLERTQNTDMSDIEKHYLKSLGKFAQNTKSPMLIFYMVELTPTVGFIYQAGIKIN